ncbi:hypothetical protein NZD89_05885 [Alicyclobacillus fastidiosus]|uniref:DUF4025 domain-containing protein n=1 Tax=Alicyclobacillus fastidiosus TaxID=392011 RepID=A0ABY6ZK23_9BACL|nr:hypothetical protein [Alicyclobacillus fastidiosus]WAH42948.1 hypothetical protein NZD89_05885 [Alicyclobacillus fastidiosus]GMA64910.1 hypothetical protein GCM10025859_53500 [Alicyclobacillus fastidiosus]
MERKRFAAQHDEHGRERNEQQLAPGLNGVEGLNAEATPEEIAEDNATKVTNLKFDEYDPSDS